MPMHDWTMVEAGIYHAFHHGWISLIGNALNAGLLPPDMYALPEQIAGGFGPDVLALQSNPRRETESGGVGTLARVLKPRPTAKITNQSEVEFYRRKKSEIVVRHVSGDRVLAVIEIVSPGNKSSRSAMRDFVEKASNLLERRIHLLVVDPFPPGPRDPDGIHGLIWSQIADDAYRLPAGKPLTLASYESESCTRAYVENLAVGEPVPEMPLFLEPDGCVSVPLEATYCEAFAVMPGRWRDVLQHS